MFEEECPVQAAAGLLRASRLRQSASQRLSGDVRVFPSPLPRSSPSYLQLDDVVPRRPSEVFRTSSPRPVSVPVLCRTFSPRAVSLPAQPTNQLVTRVRCTASEHRDSAPTVLSPQSQETSPTIPRAFHNRVVIPGSSRIISHATDPYTAVRSTQLRPIPWTIDAEKWLQERDMPRLHYECSARGRCLHIPAAPQDSVPLVETDEVKISYVKCRGGSMNSR